LQAAARRECPPAGVEWRQVAAEIEKLVQSPQETGFRMEEEAEKWHMASSRRRSRHDRDLATKRHIRHKGEEEQNQNHQARTQKKIFVNLCAFLWLKTKVMFAESTRTFVGIGGIVARHC